MITNISFMNPTFKTLTWNFTVPKEVVAEQMKRIQCIEELVKTESQPHDQNWSCERKVMPV